MEVSSDWVDQSLFKSRYPGIGCGQKFFTKEYVEKPFKTSS